MKKATEKAPDRTEAQSSQKRRNSKQSTQKDESQWKGYFRDQSWISHVVQSPPLHWQTWCEEWTG